MFTGLITDIGAVTVAERHGNDARFVIRTAYDMDAVPLGASIACSGVCLTVVEKGVEGAGSAGGGWFAAEASAETLSLTTAARWRPGTRLNLERPLRMGDELGGHMVLGHVDGMAQVTDRRPDGDSLRFTFQAPATLSRFIATKGSVALDGVSLTVNRVEGDGFTVNIIPHTATHTTFGVLRAGDAVNLEIDPLARYVARLADA